MIRFEQHLEFSGWRTEGMSGGETLQCNGDTSNEEFRVKVDNVVVIVCRVGNENNIKAP